MPAKVAAIVRELSARMEARARSHAVVEGTRPPGLCWPVEDGTMVSTCVVQPSKKSSQAQHRQNAMAI